MRPLTLRVSIGQRSLEKAPVDCVLLAAALNLACRIRNSADFMGHRWSGGGGVTVLNRVGHSILTFRKEAVGANRRNALTTVVTFGRAIVEI
jgi:hypothetical protein